MIGNECDYDHVYTGCSWDELHCTWTKRCECIDDRTLLCASVAIAPCGVGGFGGGIGSNESMPEVPEGLPWGQSCNPDNELPTQQAPRPPRNNTDFPEPDGTDPTRPPALVGVDVDVDVDADIEGRLEEECPPSPTFGSCADSYITGLVCKYDHTFMGCSWDELLCTPVMECECNQSGFDDGKWACMSYVMIPCDENTTPEDFPQGGCNPDDALPVPSTTTITTTTTGTTTTDKQPLIVDLMSGAIP